VERDTTRVSGDAAGNCVVFRRRCSQLSEQGVPRGRAGRPLSHQRAGPSPGFISTKVAGADVGDAGPMETHVTGLEPESYEGKKKSTEKS